MKSETENASKPENISIRHLLLNLKIGQAWALGTSLFILLGGMFTLGYKINDMINNPKIIALESEIKFRNYEISLTDKKMSDLKDSLDILKQGLDKKTDLTWKQTKLVNDRERFMSLYLKYELAKEKYRYQENENEFDNYMDAQKNLRTFVSDYIGNDKLIVHKGGRTDSSIEFPDGTSWPLPSELKSVSKK